MKKLLLSLLFLASGVFAANAAKLYVNTSTNVSWWTNVRIYAYNSESDNNGWNYSEYGVVSHTTTLFGKEWYVFDMGNYSNAIVQYFEASDHRISNESTAILNITHDKFIFIPGTQTDGKWAWYENGYTFRSNVLDNWGETTCNMDVVNSNTLSYTLTKDVIDASKVGKIWFRILNQEGQIYPKADGQTLDIPSSTSDYYNNWTETGWSFGIEKPTYDYEKIVITATLDGTTWTISANAYISKTVTAQVGYATFGSGANVDFSNVDGITAYMASVEGTTINKTQITTLPAGEGALLQNNGNEDVTVSIPVTASASANTGNQLVAITTKQSIAQTSNNCTNYILANNEGHFGFYKVNSAGSWCAAGTAYLAVPETSARSDFFSFDDEDATAIQTIESENKAERIYNLNGQLVKNAAKGLYIVNGKKTVIK